MKDPLQTIKTPYEILGLTRRASKPEIERAYMAALGRRIPQNVAKHARDALVLYPAERAWYELREYDDQIIGRLVPTPNDDPSVLLPAKRVQTAQAWECQLKREFPNLGLVHSLAVLWYWWVMHEEQRVHAIMDAASKSTNMAKTDLSKGSLLRYVRKAEGVSCDPSKDKECRVVNCPWRDDCIPSVPSTKEMWERSIAYWGMLAANDSFWNGSFGIGETEAKALKEKAIASLHDTLFDLARRYQTLEAGAALADKYRSLELILSTEIESAESVDKVGLRTKSGSGKVSCGILMLTHMGMLDMARSAVDEELARSPGTNRLQRLRNMLSPYSAIAVLVAHSQPQAALAAIDKLSLKERKSKEVQMLHVQALHSLAKQKASLGQMDEALEAWRLALQNSCTEALSAEIRAEIVSNCQTTAVAMQGGRRDEAIALLDKASNLVKDEKLRLTLAELLTRRGVDTFTAAQRKMEREKKGVTREIIQAFETGLADLDRAKTLGSKDAAKQAETARSVIKQAKSGFLDLSDEVQALLSKANEAAKAEDFDKGIECLRKAMKFVGRKNREVLKKNLATLLNGRAVKRANRAGEILQEVQKQMFNTALKGNWI